MCTRAGARDRKVEVASGRVHNRRIVYYIPRVRWKKAGENMTVYKIAVILSTRRHPGVFSMESRSRDSESLDARLCDCVCFSAAYVSGVTARVIL